MSQPEFNNYQYKPKQKNHKKYNKFSKNTDFNTYNNFSHSEESYYDKTGHVSKYSFHSGTNNNSNYIAYSPDPLTWEKYYKAEDIPKKFSHEKNIHKSEKREYRQKLETDAESLGIQSYIISSSNNRELKELIRKHRNTDREKKNRDRTEEYASSLGIESVCTLSNSDLNNEIEKAKNKKRRQKKEDYASSLGIEYTSRMSDTELDYYINKAKNEKWRKRKEDYAKKIGVISDFSWISDDKLVKAIEDHKKVLSNRVIVSDYYGPDIRSKIDIHKKFVEEKLFYFGKKSISPIDYSFNLKKDDWQLNYN